VSGFVFEWSSSKADENRRKHAVTFEEATTVFGDVLSKTIPDPAHSVEEDRYVTLGRSRAQRLLVVVHTDRGSRIRIISARRATRREKTEYEQHPAKAE
jgi:uncharacterized DUF497 family protein